MDTDPILPAHLETTVRSIAELHARHDRATTVVHRAFAAITGFVGRPLFLLLLTVAMTLWIVGNLAVSAMGRQAWDAAPFPAMGTAVSALALYATILILNVQRHDDRLANHRELLTLELAILSEQKSAKIIELIEKLRQDNPDIVDHDDKVATAMAAPADTAAILNAMHGPVQAT